MSEYERLKAQKDAILARERGGNVLAALRRVIAEAGSQQAAAKQLGVSGAYVTDLLRGRREFSAAMAARLGYERIVTFQRKSPEAGR